MSALISRQYLEELTIRLSTITRFMESHDNAWGQEESMSIADDMLKRARQLSAALDTSKGITSLSLEELRGRLSSMALCGIVADYDKALTALQNAIGDRVDAYERATERPDVSGRNVLDRLEFSHRALHSVMREIAGAEAIA